MNDGGGICNYHLFPLISYGNKLRNNVKNVLFGGWMISINHISLLMFTFKYREQKKWLLDIRYGLKH